MRLDKRQGLPHFEPTLLKGSGCCCPDWNQKNQLAHTGREFGEALLLPCETSPYLSKCRGSTKYRKVGQMNRLFSLTSPKNRGRKGTKTLEGKNSVLFCQCINPNHTTWTRTRDARPNWVDSHADNGARAEEIAMAGGPRGGVPQENPPTHKGQRSDKPTSGVYLAVRGLETTDCSEC